jgi:hypothetical protein
MQICTSEPHPNCMDLQAVALAPVEKTVPIEKKNTFRLTPSGNLVQILALQSLFSNDVCAPN